MASAVSATVRHSSSTSSSGSRRWSRSTTASCSSRTIRSGTSSGISTSQTPKGVWLRPFVPRREVLRLLLRERVDLDAHRRELEPGDLLVDLLRHDVDRPLELARVL